MNFSVKTFIVLTILASLMLVGRIYMAETMFLSFLWWNLLLAVIPLVFSGLLYDYRSWRAEFQVFLGLGWLFFFPNSHYLVTDFIHLGKKIEGIPIWYDGLMVGMFSLAGVLVGCLSLWQVHRVIEQKFSSKIGWYFVLTVTLLTGFGLYLGRFLRFNSWDVLANPFNLILESLSLFFSPSIAGHFYGFWLGFTAFVLVTYLGYYWLTNNE